MENAREILHETLPCFGSSVRFLLTKKPQKPFTLEAAEPCSRAVGEAIVCSGYHAAAHTRVSVMSPARRRRANSIGVNEMGGG